MESRYREAYENSLNPFNVFSEKERLQRYNEMNPCDRLLLSGTQLFVSNRYGRSACYARASSHGDDDIPS